MKAFRLIVLCFSLAAILAGCQPDIADGDIDLDTTYFPFGLGYEWRYEWHEWQRADDPGWESWDRYDTFTIRVIDSFWLDDTLCIELDGGTFNGLSNPVKITKNHITVLGKEIKIDPCKKTTYDSDKNITYKVDFIEDTLIVSTAQELTYDENVNGTTTIWTNQLKGMGAFAQGSSATAWDWRYGGWYSGFTDRLLYFYNRQDTVYKAPE